MENNPFLLEKSLTAYGEETVLTRSFIAQSGNRTLTLQHGATRTWWPQPPQATPEKYLWRINKHTIEVYFGKKSQNLIWKHFWWMYIFKIFLRNSAYKIPTFQEIFEGFPLIKKIIVNSLWGIFGEIYVSQIFEENPLEWISG